MLRGLFFVFKVVSSVVFVVIFICAFFVLLAEIGVSDEVLYPISVILGFVTGLFVIEYFLGPRRMFREFVYIFVIPPSIMVVLIVIGVPLLVVCVLNIFIVACAMCTEKRRRG